jgi:hypothetical protein
MNIKSVLEGLVISIPLVFGNVDISSSSSNAYADKLNNPPKSSACFVNRASPRKLNEEDQAFENRVWGIYRISVVEVLLLYSGFRLYKSLRKIGRSGSKDDSKKQNTSYY